MEGLRRRVVTGNIAVNQPVAPTISQPVAPAVNQPAAPAVNQPAAPAVNQPVAQPSLFAEPVAETPKEEMLVTEIEAEKPKRTRKAGAVNPDGTYRKGPDTMSSVIRGFILAGDDDDTAYKKARAHFGIVDEKNRFGETLAHGIRLELAKKGLVEKPAPKPRGSSAGLEKFRESKRWENLIATVEADRAKSAIAETTAALIIQYAKSKISLVV